MDLTDIKLRISTHQIALWDIKSNILVPLNCENRLGRPIEQQLKISLCTHGGNILPRPVSESRAPIDRMTMLSMT